jgi:hypothetical protein
MAYCHIHEGSAGVSAFPLTGRSRLLIVHFNTRAYQTTSFPFDLTNAVKVTGSGGTSRRRCVLRCFSH